MFINLVPREERKRYFGFFITENGAVFNLKNSAKFDSNIGAEVSRPRVIPKDAIIRNQVPGILVAATFDWPFQAG